MSECIAFSPYSFEFIFSLVCLKEVEYVSLQRSWNKCPAKRSENKPEEKKPEWRTEKPRYVAKRKVQPRENQCIPSTPAVSKRTGRDLKENGKSTPEGNEDYNFM